MEPVRFNFSSITKSNIEADKAKRGISFNFGPVSDTPKRTQTRTESLSDFLRDMIRNNSFEHINSGNELAKLNKSLKDAKVGKVFDGKGNNLVGSVEINGENMHFKYNKDGGQLSIYSSQTKHGENFADLQINNFRYDFNATPQQLIEQINQQLNNTRSNNYDIQNFDQHNINSIVDFTDSKGREGGIFKK